MLKLQFKDQRQPAVWLVESVTTLGSDPKNHIVIKEEGIEPQHAEIRKDGDALYLSDLGSYQGTSVNGNKILKNRCQSQTQLSGALQLALHQGLRYHPQIIGWK